MTRTALASVALVAALSAAVAQDKPPQVERWELMDEIGAKAKLMGDMVKGETPYDAAAVNEALLVLIDHGERFTELFPEGSETGHDTRALPAIWENKADFEQKAEDLVTAAAAAQGPAAEGLESFATAFRAIGQTCRACHTEYRAEES